MSKICIVDLDGVIANVEARFERAKDVARVTFADVVMVRKQEYDDVYWGAVFDPAQAPLDTLIDGAVEAIAAIERGYRVVFLTSRPEPMRNATIAWMFDHDIQASPWTPQHSQNPYELVMKPSAFQFTKTVVWKAGMIQHLAAFFGADEVLVVDDEAQNRDHLAAVLIEAQASFKSVIVESLSQAVAYVRDGTLPGNDLDDHPF